VFVPPHFAESDPTKLHDLIERHSFGLLVSQSGGEPFATHLPFLLDRTAGPHGTLSGHMARANPQWRELAGQTAMVVFSGPHAYISPSWYETENTVPTWNYVAVHAYGKSELVEDADSLLDLLQRSVGEYESGFSQPWELDTSSKVVERLLTHIVGFRIEIERLEGKWKLNQNHPVERRRKVAATLSKQPGDDARTIADLMRAMLPPGE
jgi:transcriptional regulator